MVTTHEDDRRILYSYPEAKIIDTKEDCVLGGHYHKIKTETFILLNGISHLITHSRETGKRTTVVMGVGEMFEIPPFTEHWFHIKKNSVLLGICTHAFDPEDDYKIDNYDRLLTTPRTANNS